MTLDTTPLATDSALTAQIISSRQPFPASVLLTPMTNLPPAFVPAVLSAFFSPPHAVRASAETTTIVARLFPRCLIFAADSQRRASAGSIQSKLVSRYVLSTLLYTSCLSRFYIFLVVRQHVSPC